MVFLGAGDAAADQDDQTFFWAARSPMVNDTLTVVWPVPLWLDALEVYTGSWRYPMHW
jgi:hypothetical protein